MLEFSFRLVRIAQVVVLFFNTFVTIMGLLAFGEGFGSDDFEGTTILYVACERYN